MTIDLYTKNIGNDSGQTVIFLHGLFGNHRNLLPLARKFEDQFNVVLADLRNHGQSPHNEKMDYESMCDDINQLVKSLSNQQVTIIGHSMGGKVAMLHALKYPEQTQGIFVIDIAPVSYEYDYNSIINNLLNIDLANLKSREQADTELAKHYNEPGFRQFLLQNLIRVDNQFQWRLNLEAIKNNHKSIREFPSENLSAYMKPSYFLAGAESEYITKEHEEAMQRLFPNYILQYVPEAGHWLHAEKPNLVYAELQRFFDSVYR